jgi:hypothetical protein
MRRCFTGFAIALAVLTAVEASAQTPRDRRPYRGLFGSGTGETEQMLSVSFSAGVGYDDDVLLGENSGTRPSTNPVASTLARASVGLGYSLNRARGGFSASAGASTTYYPALDQSTVIYRSGSIGGSYQLSDRTSLGGSFVATYQPLHFMSYVPVISSPLDPAIVTEDSVIPEVVLREPVPGMPNSTDPVLAYHVSNYLDMSGGAGLGQALTRRMSASVNYSFRRAESPLGERFLSQTYGGGIHYRIGRGLGARAGYNLNDARFESETTVSTNRIHQGDFGLDFMHGISLTRRTTLAVRTGTSALVDEVRTHFMFTANVQVTHELGRSWLLVGGYNRDISFLETFSHPVLADSLNAGVGGLISRRLQFQANIGASKGSVGLVGLDNGFTNYFSSAGLTYALMRNLGLSLDYSFYRYSYEVGVDLPEGIPAHSDRQSIRAGINFWAPLFSRARRANASR